MTGGIYGISVRFHTLYETLIKIALEVPTLFLMPIGTTMNNAVDRTELNNWFGDRSIPMSRRYIRDLLSRLKLRTSNWVFRLRLDVQM